jgi:hypothetical protein
MEGTISSMQGGLHRSAHRELVPAEHGHDRLSAQSDAIVYLENVNRCSEVEAWCRKVSRLERRGAPLAPIRTLTVLPPPDHQTLNYRCHPHIHSSLDYAQFTARVAGSTSFIYNA